MPGTRIQARPEPPLMCMRARKAWDLGRGWTGPGINLTQRRPYVLVVLGCVGFGGNLI